MMVLVCVAAWVVATIIFASIDMYVNYHKD